MSDALERPKIINLSYGAVSIGAVASTILVVLNLTETAVKVATVTFLLAVLFCNTFIRLSGALLLRSIDSRVQRSRQDQGSEEIRQQMTAARKRIATAIRMSKCGAAQMLVMAAAAVCTRYGTAAPIFFFISPMTVGPLMWHSANIQLHAGRSKLRAAQASTTLLPLAGRRWTRLSSSSVGTTGGTLRSLSIMSVNAKRVIPVEIVLD